MSIKAVIDTNLLVRAIISPGGGSAVLIKKLKQGCFQSITSSQHLREIYQVLAYPHIKERYKITDNQRKRLISQLYTRSIFLTPTGRIALCKDPKDDYLIEIALLGQITHLVTEDRHLHNDSKIVYFLSLHNIEVIRLKEFLMVLTS